MFCMFSDMSVERNLLLEKAYPTLRAFCQKLGLDFQVNLQSWKRDDDDFSFADLYHKLHKLVDAIIVSCLMFPP